MKKLAAVIVETRPLPNIEQVIQGHIKHLPKDTDLFIFGTNALSWQGSDIYKKIHSFIETQVQSESEYNILLASAVFWSEFKEYERVLIFQHDSMILRPGIEEFYKYDYVGATWDFPPFRGNGGFSLRNPKVMLEICGMLKYNSNLGNEDVYFCNAMCNYGIGKLAPVAECDKFSVESKFHLGSLGYHAIEKWLSAEECEQIKNQYK